MFSINEYRLLGSPTIFLPICVMCQIYVHVSVDIFCVQCTTYSTHVFLNERLAVSFATIIINSILRLNWCISRVCNVCMHNFLMVCRDRLHNMDAMLTLKRWIINKINGQLFLCAPIRYYLSICVSFYFLLFFFFFFAVQSQILFHSHTYVVQILSKSVTSKGGKYASSDRSCCVAHFLFDQTY